MLEDAVEDDLLAANPAQRPCNLPPPSEFVGQEIPEAHTQAIRAALAELAGEDPLYVRLFDVALATGLRLGEVRALQWRHVDFKRSLIRVERAYSRDTIKEPKTKAGKRSVPMFSNVITALRAQAAQALEGGRYAPDALVFANVRGGPIHPSNFNRRVWRPALRLAEARLSAAGGEVVTMPYRWHDLRHTAISRLIQQGADVKLVQQVAGHSRSNITLDRYSHVLEERITDAATRFDPARQEAAVGTG